MSDKAKIKFAMYISAMICGLIALNILSRQIEGDVLRWTFMIAGAWFNGCAIAPLLDED